MGKAVPKNIKSRAGQLLEVYPDKFTGDFSKNNEFVKTLKLPLSKSTINRIVGYIGRSVKKSAAAA